MTDEKAFCTNCGKNMENSIVVCATCGAAQGKSLEECLYCGTCGTKMVEAGVVCTSCGVKQGKTLKYCSNCGYEVNEEQDICLHCRMNPRSKIPVADRQKQFNANRQRPFVQAKESYQSTSQPKQTTYKETIIAGQIVQVDEDESVSIQESTQSQVNPGVAAFINLLLIGLPHLIWFKQPAKGIVLFFATIFLTFISAGILAIPCWIITSIDAYMIAKRINNGEMVKEWQFF